MPIQEWTEDTQSGMSISIIEGIESAVTNDETRVSLFTGDTTNGFVYRRIFDISENKVAKVGEQRMVNRHYGSVSALCHVEASNYVVSGNTTGKIYVNDHDNGRCTQTIDVGRGIIIGSIISCPFSPNLFAVGCCNPKNKLLIYDNRLRINKGKPSLTLKDAGSVIKTKYNRPAWDAETGLICLPVRKYADGTDAAAINIWDPRFVKCSTASNLMLTNRKKDVFSVDFTHSMEGRNRAMITASEDSIRFARISINKHLQF
ncbi:hypothetical protein GGI05_005403 [Coemansia sp. RSA 2603]|nr:hypothetical protein GGI05_005403 [Coemansia sp. RSA 2603]